MIPGLLQNGFITYVTVLRQCQFRGQFHQHSMRNVYACRSQKCKKTVKLSIIFALLGSALSKAAHRMLMKLTPGVRFFAAFCIYIDSCFATFVLVVVDPK